MRQYKLDMESYERIKNFSYDEVNTLLTNVYSTGYNDCKATLDKKSVALQLCDYFDANKIKGLGKKVEDVKALIMKFAEEGKDGS